MSSTGYDAIVVGARCAGSPTAMLLARSGHRVLLVDRDHFPSDTISTHLIHPPGLALLRQWGLLDGLLATGCPTIGRYSYDFEAFTIAGRPAPADGVSVAAAPRRTVLDKLLLDAAIDAGVEVREKFAVEEIVFTEGRASGIRGHGEDGVSVTEDARVIIGADGRYSLVARAVRADEYSSKGPIQASYYSYWSGLPVSEFEIYVRPHRAWAAIPTHDDLTVVVLGWPYAEFEANKKDVEANYFKAVELSPDFAQRLRQAKREAPFRGAAVPNFLRRPFGSGWVLVGDAGHTKDPVTAWGISDAFRDASAWASALDQWLTGRGEFDVLMAAVQQARDEQVRPMFDLTCEFATLAPPAPPLLQLLTATAATTDAQDQFVSMMAGTLPVPSFFEPENVQRIIAMSADSGGV
jgi:2-polyprenyl-6-methoxyphenol hydroxylase-like FAD-dependent oxidoreductase